MESSGKCKDFITTAEIEERKKKRQEEWEKVRKPEDPLEAPEEEYDSKSLYDRLQEQKEKHQAEFEESRRLKNLIKGLDDDEVAFLELVDKTKTDIETKLWQEEVKEIQEFKKAVAHLSEEKSEARLKELRKSIKVQNSGVKKSQQDLLALAVKRKASNGSTSQEKRQCSGLESGDSVENRCSSSPTSSNNETDQDSSPTGKTNMVHENTKSLHCFGILPGLGAYSDSSDSDNSSNSDVELEKNSEFDLIDND